MEKADLVKVKVALCGQGAAGKTSIINRFVNNTFNDDHDETPATETFQKSILYNDIDYQLEIWDTAGQERFYEQAAYYIKSIQGALQVCDTTAEDGLETLEKWYGIVRENCPSYTSLVICGNKIDLVDDVIVTEEILKKFAEDRKEKYIMVSAQNDFNVQKAFLTILDNVVDPSQNQPNLKGGLLVPTSIIPPAPDAPIPGECLCLFNRNPDHNGRARNCYRG